jgi:putative CocE/NonD family hydrolase
VRGIENGVDRQRAVRYFVMGANEWRDADRWPLPEAEARTMFLGAPAVPGGPGTLATEAPGSDAPASSFVSDPASPVLDAHPFYAGANDYRSLASRKDVLVFDTAPLERDTEVTGPITAEIHLSCDAPDTDLWVRVLDVAPDGTALNLMSAGLDVLRASYRNGGRELLEPGQVYPLVLDRLMTSQVFRKGHRIRVQISATFFPAFSRNLHTGARETSSAETRTATITIHHDRRHASRIVLPIAGLR